MTDEQKTLPELLDRAITLLQDEDFQKVEFTAPDNLFISAAWIADNKIRIDITAKGE